MVVLVNPALWFCRAVRPPMYNAGAYGQAQPGMYAAGPQQHAAMYNMPQQQQQQQQQPQQQPPQQQQQQQLQGMAPPGQRAPAVPRSQGSGYTGGAATHGRSVSVPFVALPACCACAVCVSRHVRTPPKPPELQATTVDASVSAGAYPGRSDSVGSHRSSTTGPPPGIADSTPQQHMGPGSIAPQQVWLWERYYIRCSVPIGTQPKLAASASTNNHVAGTGTLHNQDVTGASVDMACSHLATHFMLTLNPNPNPNPAPAAGASGAQAPAGPEAGAPAERRRPPTAAGAGAGRSRASGQAPGRRRHTRRIILHPMCLVLKNLRQCHNLSTLCQGHKTCRRRR